MLIFEKSLYLSGPNTLSISKKSVNAFKGYWLETKFKLAAMVTILSGNELKMAVLVAILNKV
jgi:hypothetical protein